MKLASALPIVFLLSVLVFSGCSNSPMNQLEKPLGPSATEEAKMPPAIIGNWRSLDAEPFAKNIYVTREYHLSATRWEFIQTFSEDKNMKHTIAILHTEGSYQIANESAQNPGVWAIQMRVGSRGLVLKTKKAKVAKELGINNCALNYNHEKDISDRGCGPFVSIKDCPLIYDVVKLDSNYLLFGAPASDARAFCSESGRPTALGLPLRKIN